MLFLNIAWIQVATPLRMSFEEKRKVDTQWVIFDSICDFFFLFDLILTFFIPKSNKEGIINIINLINLGEFVFDRKDVAKKYLKTWFIPDLVACIPYSIGKALP